MVDRVKPLKMESADTGGDENDEFPTSLDPEEDHLECAGIVLDDPGLIDESTVIWRDVDDMMFKDTNNPAGATLTELLATGGITPTAHRTLRQLIHFIESGGPAEGFFSGAYREITGGVFPTSVIWWESSAKLKKIVERLITWGTSPKAPTQDQWKMYDTDGVTVLATVTDAITYSGAFETSRTRSIA